MSDQPQTVELFNIPFSKVSLDEVRRLLEQRIVKGEPGFIVTPNVNHVCMYQRDAAFRGVYRKAFLALPDGVPIMWAARLFHKRLPEKLSGSDLVPILSEFAAERGYRVFFLGGTPGTAEQTAAILRARYPALQVAGHYAPPYGFEQEPAEMQRVLDMLHEAKPQICFIALGSPKQELWMGNHYHELDIPVCIGVGASFDFISGRIRRAPAWIQRLGAEWLWRLAMEPRRLWRRYLLHDLSFLRILWQEARKQARNANPSEASR